MTLPDKAQLAEARLETPLIGWLLATYTETGSWELTARRLHERTSIDVSRETVRRWANEHQATP